MKKTAILLFFILASIISFIQPVWAEIAYYNFSDTANNKAYKDPLQGNLAQPPAGTDGWTGSEVTGAEYTNLNSNNGVGATTTSTTNGDEPFFRFNFTINENVNKIQWIYVLIKHQSTANTAGEDCAAIIWNFTTASWVSFYATDANAGAGYVTATNNYTSGFSDIIDGSKQLVLMSEGNGLDTGEACDVDFVQVQVGYGATPPVITIQSPLNATYNATSVWFNVTLDEAGSWCGYSLDGMSNVTMSNTSGNWNAQNTSMTQGSHNVEFYCNNTYGNMNSTSALYFTVDTVAPTVSITAPASDGLWYNTAPGITASCTDSNFANMTINHTSYTATKTSTPATWTNISAVPQGTNSVKVTCTDAAGNTGTADRSFNFDDISPSAITYVSPTENDGANKSRDWVYVNITFTETNPDTCLLEFANGTTANYTMVRTGTNCYLNMTGQSDGTKTYKVYVNDSAGNIGVSAARAITLDTVSPMYSVNSTNSTLAGTYTLFSLYWTDNINLSGYIFSFDNGTGTFVNDSYAAFTGISNWSNVTKYVNSTVGSTIRWQVYANDTAGNMNTSLVYSFVTAEAPQSLIRVAYYNFSDTTNNKVYKDVLQTSLAQPPAGTDGWTGSEVTSAEYADLNTSNNIGATATSGGNGREPFFRFNFTINENANKIQWIYVLIKHQSTANTAGEDCAAIIWNFTTSSWVRFYATDAAGGAGYVTATNNYTSGFSSMIDASKQLVLMSEGDGLDTGEACDVDFAEVQIGYDATSFLEVNLSEPSTSQPTNIIQNTTFTVNATVVCRQGSCGNVNGTLLYNKTSQNPDTPVNITSGAEPLFIQEASPSAIKSCGTNPLSEDEFCNLTWTINATDTTLASWKLAVNFSSDSGWTASNTTQSAVVSIQSCSVDITLQWTAVNFTNPLIPNTYNNPASGNANQLYNISVNDGSCDTDLYIKGTDMENSALGYTLGVGNLTWGNTSNPASSYNMTKNYSSLKSNVAKSTNVTTWYWINVPPLFAANYNGTVFIQGVKNGYPSP